MRSIAFVMIMSRPHGTVGFIATRYGKVSAKASIAFPLKMQDKVKWQKLRKQLLKDKIEGWTSRRSVPYTNGEGALTFSCYEPKYFGNLTAEWIERMTLKVSLISEA